MYTGRFNRQAPDRKTPPSASILAALRLALGDVAHMFPPPPMCAACIQALPPCARLHSERFPGQG